MSDICVPAGTDWSCVYDDETLAQMRAEPKTAAVLDRAEAFAWSLLAALTAYRIGTCPVAVRPCAARCTPDSNFLAAPVRSSGSWLPRVNAGGPYISGGNWYNACGCSSQKDCGCSTLSEVILPGPVGSIVSVTIDGEPLPRAAYRVDNGNRLVRLDGEAWPGCQDMAASAADAGSFVVTYYRGAAPNLMTRAAAGALAQEFYLACKGEACRLPWNLTSMARSGESYDFGDGGVDSVADAIPEVAAVVRIYNPYGLKSQPFVASPDLYDTRTPTWS